MRKINISVAILILAAVLTVGCGESKTVYYTPEEEQEEEVCSKALNVYVDEYDGVENENMEARSCIIVYKDSELTMPYCGSSNNEKPLFTDKSNPGSPDMGSEGQTPNDIWIMVFVDIDGDGLDIHEIEEGEPYHPDCPLYIPVGQYDCGETIEVHLDSFDDTYLW